MATTAEFPRVVQIRVALPDEIADLYSNEAAITGRDIEDVLAARLISAAGYTATKPLYFDDAQRQELEATLGRNVLHTRDALLQIRNAMSVRVGRVIIPLK